MTGICDLMVPLPGIDAASPHRWATRFVDDDEFGETIVITECELCGVHEADMLYDDESA